MGEELNPFEIPYLVRQRIVIVPDDQAELLRNAPEKGAWQKEETTGPRERLLGLRRRVTEKAGESIAAALAKMREREFELMPLGDSEASPLRFPPGHPQRQIVYVGHPVAPSLYYPAAAFHRYLVEHKFAEIHRILTGLGATHIEVEQIQGWSDERVISAVLENVPSVEAGFHAKRRKRSKSHLIGTSELPGSTQPRLPSGLVWLRYEPTWEQIVEARMDHGLREFTLMLRHQDDMGVDRGLKASVKKAGLELGGEFVEHESIQWKLSGTFL